MSEFSQVTQGESFGFPAKLYNRLIDAVIGDLTKNQQPQGLPLSYQFTRGQSQFVRVFNNSGIDIREFSPIGLEGLVFTPGDTPGDKKESDFIGNNYIFEGIKPDETKHKMKFAMTQERILDQQTGLCVVDGLTIARIKMAAPQTTDEVARVGILTDDVVNLHQSFWGAEVLFIDSDLNEIIDESFSHWALIKMGRHQPISGITGKAQAAIAAGATGNITEALADATEIGPNEQAVNYGSNVSNNDKIIWGVDQKGTVFFTAAEAAGGGSQGNFFIEFTDEDDHKFFIEGTMLNNGADILTILMTGGPNVSMDGAGAASGLVTLQLGLDQAGNRTWELDTPDGNAIGQMYDDLGDTTTPLTGIAIGAHTWSMIFIDVTENLPAGTNLPGAW